MQVLLNVKGTRGSAITEGPPISGTLHWKFSKSAVGQMHGFEILAFTNYHDLETWVRGHLRSLKVTMSFDRLHILLRCLHFVFEILQQYMMTSLF